MEGVDIIVYTAGMRRARICEQDLFEAVQTNIFELKTSWKLRSNPE